MRVLLLSQYFYPEVGATQTRMYEFARTLAELGHEVDVLAEFPNHPAGVIPPEYRGRFFEVDRRHPFRIIRVRVLASPRKTFWTRLGFYGSFFGMALAASLRLPRRYDAVVATSPPLPVAAAGWLASRLKGAAFVMDVRDLWPTAARALGELSSGALYRLAERLESRLYAAADRITATTRSFCRHIVARGVSPTKVVHVPNGTLPALFAPERGDADLRHRLGLEGRFVVTYAGLHGIAQGLDTVLEAAARLREDPEVRFLFLGEGPEKARLASEAGARALANVLFLPQVPLEDSVHYLNASDALLVPLRADPVFRMFIPSKLFDALACGKPVLLSVDGEAREVLEDSGGGLFVPPGDPDALVRAIQHLARQPALRKEMGERGRLYVTRHYQRGVEARRFAAVVADAVAARRAGRTPPAPAGSPGG